MQIPRDTISPSPNYDFPFRLQAWWPVNSLSTWKRRKSNVTERVKKGWRGEEDRRGMAEQVEKLNEEGGAAV